jgi:transcriptional regulator with XRE-family HTH domain
MSKKTGNSKSKNEGFGSLLQEARAKAGMSVRDLAAAVKDNPGPDVSITLICMLEKNKRVPTYEIATVLAETLSLDRGATLEVTHRSRIQYCIDREATAYRNAKARFRS